MWYGKLYCGLLVCDTVRFSLLLKSEKQFKESHNLPIDCAVEGGIFFTER
jgi:hypothetical protein